MVCNHLSWLDIPVLAGKTHLVFIAMSRPWPLFSFVLKYLGMISIERNAGRENLKIVTEKMRGVLARGEGICFFPEATTSYGEDLLPFRSPLFEGALFSDTPVFCAALSYKTPPGWPGYKETICWVDWTPFPVHLFRFLKLPPVHAFIKIDADPIYGINRKDLSKKAEERVRLLYQYGK